MIKQQPDLSQEQQHWQQGVRHLAGVDEVGRGCLSGPVLAAAVIIPPYCTPLTGVCDSKKLSAKQRNTLCQAIIQQAVRVGIGIASVKEIEQLNIFYASFTAMQRALAKVQPCEHALIDGRDTDKIDLGAHTAIIKGDSSSYAIACASIVAKVVRDDLMRRLAQHFPHYAWERNAGYGTKAHLQGLQAFGVSPLHRRGYAPVKKRLQDTLL